MKFEPVDLQTLPRGQMFYYFSRMAPTGYSLTVSMDVTKLRQTLKGAGLKFFPAYLWLVTKNLNQQMEFKMAIQEEKLGYFDSLTPLYAAFHPEDHTFSMMWTEFSDDFNVFYQNYLENQERYGKNKGVLCRPELPPRRYRRLPCPPVPARTAKGYGYLRTISINTKRVCTHWGKLFHIIDKMNSRR